MIRILVETDKVGTWLEIGSCTHTVVGLRGPAGPPGPAGDAVGQPVGGVAGELLRKDSHYDFDSSWSAPEVVVVIYDDGWPESRPNAYSVMVVGGSEAPSWLANTDIYFQEAVQI